MTNLSSTLSSIIIEGNSVDYGFATVNGSSIIQYSYLTDFQCSGDATIKNNTFSGMASNSSNDMLNLLGNCLVSGNYFIRGTNIINSYIRANSFDHIITHNIFDSPTVDGASNETLVLNFSSGTIYKENKNQTGYTSIYLADLNNLPAVSFVNSGIHRQLYVSSAVGGTAPTGGGVSNFFGSLNRFFPTNVQLLFMVVGVTANSVSTAADFDTSSAFNNEFGFAVQLDRSTVFSNTNPNPVPPSSFLNSQADVVNDTSPYAFNYTSNTLQITSGNIATFITSTYYTYVDLTTNTLFPVITSSNNNVEMSFSLSLKALSTKTASVILSPILIKYRW